MIAAPTTPSLRRRLACFVYEGVLLFGVVMAAGLAYGIATNQRHALVGHRGLQIWLFLVLGAYFVGFWSRQGQTLPMRTWHIKLVRAADGAPVSIARCACRYVLAWLWFVPGLAILAASGLPGPAPFVVVLLAGVLTYAATSALHPSRQFMHDALCGTRLIDTRQGHNAAP